MSQVEQSVDTESTDQQDDNQAARKLQQVWLRRIKDEEKSHKDWRDRGRDVQEVFNDDLGSDEAELFVPLLWSVVQVEHSGVYSSQPIPDVRPANDEKNPDFRKAGDVLERGIGHFVDDQSFDDNFHRTVDDYLAIGLGTIRVKLTSEIIDIPIKQDPPPADVVAAVERAVSKEDQAKIAKHLANQTEKGIGNQSINWEYVSWDRFGWEPCNSWRVCDWIYFRHRMTGAQIKERFGKSVRASKDKHDKNDHNSWKRKTYDIYEVWDRKHRKVLFIAKNETEPVEVNDDPLQLEGFYPIPTPMMTNIPSGELLPKADYDYIEPYDKELNRLQERRMALIAQIKAVGAHDKGLPELADILGQSDGESLPVQNLGQRLQAGGGKRGFDAVWFELPLEEKVLVLAKLTEQIAVVKAQVDEILGIADIVRGVTNAKEGVGTQELKGRWVGIRLSRKRDTVAYTTRQMFRMMGQLLTTHFTDENLMRLTQVEITPQVMQMLRNDLLMDFAIDIETDSTVARDEFRERETRQNMLTSVGAYVTTVLPSVASGQLPADVASAILRASLQPYAKYSRALDESMADLQTTVQQLHGMNNQIQEQGQEIQQLTARSQQWETIARTLQSQATEARTKQQTADAGLKIAKTEEIVEGLEDVKLQPLKTAAEIDHTRAETEETERGTVQ